MTESLTWAARDVHVTSNWSSSRYSRNAKLEHVNLKKIMDFEKNAITNIANFQPLHGSLLLLI